MRIIITAATMALAAAFAGCGQGNADKPAQAPQAAAQPTQPAQTPPPAPQKPRTDEERELPVARDAGDGPSRFFDLAEGTSAGAVVLRDRCDIPFLVMSMAAKGRPGFADQADSVPLSHWAESCAKAEYLTRNRVPMEDRQNTIKMDEHRKAYVDEANAKLQRFAAAEAFVVHSASALIGHYDLDRQAFWLKASFPSHDAIRKSREARLVDSVNAPRSVDSLEFTPVYLAGTPTMLRPTGKEEAEAIEADISRGGEGYEARYVITPVALSGIVEEAGPGAGRNLDNAYLYVRIERAAFYRSDDRKRSVRLATLPPKP